MTLYNWYILSRWSDKVAILETKNALYHFSSAWLYTRGIDRDFIERIDRQLVHLRIQGEVRETNKPSTAVPRQNTDISSIASEDIRICDWGHVM